MQLNDDMYMLALPLQRGDQTVYFGSVIRFSR